ncbi:hypothetical protein NZK35_03535 [Stieleria sp. ICT_E10.1]|uniref:hypothetical protein n=1 Tax=Stieleria sedimenti TaxID=2976331 RepID=UPI00217F96E5|nr:hypothetical protein [Stieleria sedimenti]MCS7465746.1 hypothetical protein [Stieleria sedimenti]
MPDFAARLHRLVPRIFVVRLNEQSVSNRIVSQHATSTRRAVPSRNDNRSRTGKIALAVWADQLRVFEIGSICVIKAKEHQRKSNKEHYDRSKDVSQVGIGQAKKTGDAQRNEHHGDRTRHPPPKAALASGTYRCVFRYGHEFEDASASTGGFVGRLFVATVARLVQKSSSRIEVAECHQE